MAPTLDDRSDWVIVDKLTARWRPFAVGERRLRDKDNSTVELERELTHLKAKQLLTEEQVRSKQVLLEAEEKKKEDALSQVRAVNAQLAEAQSKMKEKDVELANMKSRMENKLKLLEQQKTDLADQARQAQEALGKMRTQHEELRFRSQQREAELRTELDRVQEQGEHTKTQLEKQERLEKEVDELRAQLTAARRSSAGSTTSKDQDIVYQHMRADLEHYKHMEANFKRAIKEAEFLKELVQNGELLKEQITALQGKLARAEELRPQLHRLQIENEELRREKEKWNSQFLGLTPSSTESPAALSRALADLKRENELLLQKLGDQSAKNSSLQLTLAEREAQLTQQQQREKELQTQINQLKDISLRHEQQSAMLRKESQGFKALLETFSTEEAMVQQDEQFDKMKQARIQKCVQERDDYITQVLKGQAPPPFTALIEAQEKDARLTDLSHENAKLQRELDRMSRDLALMEARTGRGEFNPNTTKVVHMIANPASDYGESAPKEVPELDQVKEENARLRAQLQQAEQAHATAQRAPAHATSAESAEEVARLKEEVEILQSKLQQSDARVTRLSTAAKKKIHDFREMVYVLFGYQVDYIDKQYRVKPKYGAGETDFLLFQTSGANQVEMLESDFSHRISAETQQVLHEHGSIPVFMATLTIELYNQYAMQQSATAH